MKRRDFLKLSSVAIVAPAVILTETAPPSIKIPLPMLAKGALRTNPCMIFAKEANHDKLIYGPNGGSYPYHSHYIEYDISDIENCPHWPITFQLRVNYKQDNNHVTEEYHALVADKDQVEKLFSDMWYIDIDTIFEGAIYAKHQPLGDTGHLYDLHVRNHKFQLANVKFEHVA